jgi:drug/metabolite transporter (DMT)-like permease
MNKPYQNKVVGALLAIGAALLYAISTPFSKMLLIHSSPAMMATFLYLGAGVGIALLTLLRVKAEKRESHLVKSDVVYVIGMVVLDIAAPILLMLGLQNSPSSSASLLNNFEIVATALIALFVFKEKISWQLWIGIGLIFFASVFLTFDGSMNFSFSWSSLYVLGAACCWGLENNFTRKISNKSSAQIVIIKGLGSGAGALIVALIVGERFPDIQYIGWTMLLGFFAYGLSIFLYVRSQRLIGAAKTSTYYAIAPFVGALLAFLILKEMPNWWFFLALGIMFLGSTFVVIDTLFVLHKHTHKHVINYDEGGRSRVLVVEHSHPHVHIGLEEEHRHNHDELTRSHTEKNRHNS